MSDRRDVESGSDPGVYTPKELAAGEEASTPTDAVGGRVGGEGAGVAGLGATTESQTGGALTSHMQTHESEADLPATGIGGGGALVVGGPYSNPYAEPAAVDDRAGLDRDLQTTASPTADRLDQDDLGTRGQATTEYERDRMAP